jgi:hypothetical protein
VIDEGPDEDPHELESARPFRRKPIGPFAIVAYDLWSNAKICRAGADGALVFIFALTVNARRGRTGSFPASDIDPWYVARQLGIDEPRARQALERAIGARLLEIDDDTAFVVGWSEEWSRAPMTVSERERKRAYRERQSETKTQSQKQSETKKQSETQTQKEKKRGPGHVRDKSGHRVRVDPPITPAEDAAAVDVIISGLGAFGITHTTGEEREHVARLLRDGHDPNDLVQLMRYIADDGGAGWFARRDRDGRTHMRGNVNVLCMLSEKQIARYQAPAVGDWMPSDRLQRWQEDQAARASGEQT